MGSKWLVCPEPRVTPAVRVFCFPYAGAGARIFGTWTGRLGNDVEIIAVRLPGRESRISEVPINEWPHLMEAVSHVIQPFADIPFVLYGHSFGASVAYEMAVVSMQKHLPLQHLIVSGRCPPHLPPRQPPMHNLMRPQFLERLEALNGMAVGALHDEGFLRVLEPMLRADIKLAETARDLDSPSLNVPLTAFCGFDDEIAPCSAVQKWEGYTRQKFSIHCFEGAHFFCTSSETEILAVISQICSAIIENLPT